MKKVLLLLGVVFSTMLFSQELQLHYDFGKDRQFFTTTFEIFKPDDLGSTFMFADINYDRSDGASLTYFEIARKFNIKNTAIEGLNFHIEYNDGFLISDGEQPKGIPINQAVLAGVGLPIKIGSFTLHTSYLYKWIKGSNGLDGQFTAVWFQNFLNNKITFRGFLDFWSAPLGGDKNNKQGIFITEPQILYNINKSFSIGSELEISKNFVSSDEFQVNPTVMLRWVW